MDDLFPQHRAPLFLEAVVARLTGTSVDARNAKIGYVRWRPGSSCTVVWSFAAPGGREIAVCGTLPSRTGGRRRTIDVRAIQAGGGAGARPLALERRLVLQVFPHDEGLPGLAFAASARSVGEELDIELADAVGMSWKPGHRCVLRYRDAQQRPVLFGKLFRDARGAAMADRVALLREQLARKGACCDLPAPVAYVSSARMVVFEAVPDATEMKQLVRTAAADGERGWANMQAAIDLCVQTLGSLRRLPSDGLPVRSPENLLAELSRTQQSLDPILPDFASALAARVGALAQRAAELAPEPLVLCHGAFRHGQLLLRNDRMIVLDLDSLCRAGPAADAGTFLAGLDKAAARNRRLRPMLAACAHNFVATLQRTAPVDPGWLVWHRAAACAQAAVRSLLSLDPDWPQRAALLLGDPRVSTPAQGSPQERARL